MKTVRAGLDWTDYAPFDFSGPNAARFHWNPAQALFASLHEPKIYPLIFLFISDEI